MLATLKWMLRAVLIIGFTAIAANCTMLGLNYASLETANKPALRPALTDDFDAASTRATLEQELYGPWPAALPVKSGPLRMIDPDYLDGRGTLEEIAVSVGSGEGARTFRAVLALPNSASTEPVPVLISQTFADNCSVFPDSPVTDPRGETCTGSNLTGMTGALVTGIFGRYIAVAPVERYFDAGLGYASFSGSSLVPDSKAAAPQVMAALGPDPAPTSTLMAWAFGFHAVAGELSADPRIRDDATAAIGHSRYGKAALIAAAWSDQVDAAITHQSGFAGAASSRSTTGETLERMARTYPHWLRPGLADDLKAGQKLALDQHFLLALAAPKPVFLGNGRRDVWSDPNSTYRVAEAADRVYEAAGSSGLPETGMRDFQPDADLSYWLRAGGHSVVSRDIDAFIAFATAHFGHRGGLETAFQTAQ